MWVLRLKPTVPVPASKKFTLNCRYRHCKQKLSGAHAGSGTALIVHAIVTIKVGLNEGIQTVTTARFDGGGTSSDPHCCGFFFYLFS